MPLRGNTLPHPPIAKSGAAQVMIKPAFAGTGVLAGGCVRAVLEAAGVKDVLTKSLGSSNPLNVVRATLEGLSRLRDPNQVGAERHAAAALPVPGGRRALGS